MNGGENSEKGRFARVNFLDGHRRTTTISVRKPVLGLTPEQIKTAMDGMVATGAYKGKNGRLKAPYSFKLTLVSATQLV